MIDAVKLGELLAEEVINKPGPCFYPGKFKPPHKGHYEAAENLASRNYVQKVIILISSKVIDGITPEDSMQIWQMYLQAKPNPKITVRMSTDESPIQTIIGYLQSNPLVDPVYVAGGNDEVDDQSYLKSLQDQFGGRVRTIQIGEKAGQITAPYVRSVLQSGNYEEFAKSVPEAAYNKGVAPKAFQLLAPKIKDDTE